MGLIEILIVLVIVGVIVWMINTYIPMPPWMKTVINLVAAFIVLLWLLQVFGFGGYLHHALNLHVTHERGN